MLKYKVTSRPVLIVDDDPAILDYLEAFLSNMGINSVCIEDPCEGIKLLSNGSSLGTEQFELALVDVKMPGMSGTDFLKNAQKIAPQLTVILMSAFGDIEDAISGIRLGAYEYVKKPFNENRLKIVLRNALKLKEIEKSTSLIGDFKCAGVFCPSSSMQSIYETVRRVALCDSNVLIYGESGVGKELIAQAVHENSNRSSKPFVSINCSAIPDTLLESELFGHSKGSFTGAIQERKGLFNEADGGTLFLDEIGELNQVIQIKLLRVLQERTVRPVGSNIAKKIDVRIVTATNKNLLSEVNNGNFREDLYYRLNVIPIQVPPLRQRKEDIMVLANYFLEKQSKVLGLEQKQFARDAVDKLMRMRFRGNVRELQNIIERSAIMSTSSIIQASDIHLENQIEMSDFLDDISSEMPSLRKLEAIYIRTVMDQCGGDKDSAAKILGLSRRSIYRKLSESADTLDLNPEDSFNESLNG